MTIKDVAAYCGVSVSTVSRVLNGHPDVKEELRSRVQKAIQQLHYVPNTSARDLVKISHDTIGILAKGVGNPFFSEIIPHIEDEIAKAGYSSYLHQIGTDSDEIEVAVRLALSKKLGGLILLGGCSDYTPERTQAITVPFVCCTFSNEFGSLDKAAYSSVSIDDIKEGARAVDVLWENGHRKIALVLDSKSESSVGQLRYRGYIQALTNHGITPDEGLIVETGSYELRDVYAAVKRLCENRKDFTAIFAISDTMGIAAIRAAADCGRRVPDDLSVITIDGIELTGYTVPPLTALSQPKKQLGEEAVHLLMDVMEGRKTKRLKLDAVLREGGSVKSI